MPPRPLEDLLEFLKFESISASPQHRDRTHACASWLSQKLTDWGLENRLYPTPGHPVLVARGPWKTGRPTVLIYGHYDVQPPEPLELWSHPPFEPHVEKGVITARGSSDNKGQIMAHLCGAAALIAEPEGPPVNLLFLIEGEEEVGSPNLRPFLTQYREALACDVIVISDSAMIAPDVPTLTYGLRGLTTMEIVVEGPKTDLHSGMYGGVITNPATVLARLIGSLHRPDGSVAVEGFYEGAQEPLLWEIKSWKNLPFDAEALLRISGSPALGGEAAYSPLERLWARPTAEVNGLYGGYQGPGSKTVLPSRAGAKLSFRLVPGQEPERILDLVEAHFRKQTPASVTVTLIRGHGGPAYLFNPESPEGTAALRALENAFGTKPVLGRDGATIPILSDFREILGAETLLLGLCMPDCNAHAPNETFPVAQLEAGIRLHRELMRELALVGKDAPC